MDAGTNPCDTAARTASAQSGVPVDILMAISRVETGRSRGGALEPWPWTVNEAGAGSFFDSVDAAKDHVRTAMANGKTNIDIGCFQINVRWHGAEFTSLGDMFDPAENAHYAARFLLKLHAEFGGWEGAIGAYHSRQEATATGYLAKVAAVMRQPVTESPPVVVAEDLPRDNRYPLLRPGRTSGFGSLVSTAFDHPVTPLLR
jgi:hypothetical protein